MPHAFLRHLEEPRVLNPPHHPHVLPHRQLKGQEAWCRGVRTRHADLRQDAGAAWRLMMVAECVMRGCLWRAGRLGVGGTALTHQQLQKLI